MTKKLEYADAVYYCRVKKELQTESFDWVALGDGKTESLDNTECNYSPEPNCRSCPIQKHNKWIFDRSQI